MSFDGDYASLQDMGVVAEKCGVADYLIAVVSVNVPVEIMVVATNPHRFII